MMKRISLACIIVLLSVFCIGPQFVAAGIFSDTENHWAEDYIQDLYDQDIVKGRGQGMFAPEETVTRAEFIKMLVIALFGEPSPAASDVFFDVFVEDWFSAYVLVAKDKEMVSGYDGGKFFRPNQNITRAEAVKILIVALGEDTSAISSTVFTDVSGWQVPFVQRASDLGIVGGYSATEFGPNDLLTRAQAAKVIHKVLAMKGVVVEIEEENIVIDSDFDLQGVYDQGEIVLSWQYPTEDTSAQIVLMKSTTNSDLTFPPGASDDYMILSAGTTEYRDAEIFIKAQTYHYRLCLYENQQCMRYSRNFKMDILGGTVDPIPTPLPPEQDPVEEEETVGNGQACYASRTGIQVGVPAIKTSFLNGKEEGWKSSPAVMDLDGDGSKEIIAARGAMLYVWKDTGNVLWKAPWGESADSIVQSKSGRIWAPAVVGDFDHNGFKDIAVGSTGNVVNVYEYNGEIRKGWPKVATSEGSEILSLAASDLNGDKILEIVGARAIYKPAVHVWDAFGNEFENWPQCNQVSCVFEQVFDQNVALGDLDGDGLRDVVVTSDIPAMVAVWSNDSKQHIAHPIYGHIDYLSEIRPFHDYVYVQEGGFGAFDAGRDRSRFGDSPPVVADLDLNGTNELILIGSHEIVGETGSKGNSVFVLQPDGTRSRPWTIPFTTGEALYDGDPSYGIVDTAPTPTVADITGDTKREIIFPANDGRIYALSHDNKPLWKFDYAQGKQTFATEVVVADLNQDGKPELIFTTYSDKGGDASMFILSGAGKQLVTKPIPGRGSMAAPTIDNADGDDELEMLISLKDPTGGNFGGLVMYDLPGSSDNCMPWPTARANYLRTGSLD